MRQLHLRSYERAQLSLRLPSSSFA